MYNFIRQMREIEYKLSISYELAEICPDKDQKDRLIRFFIIEMKELGEKMYNQGYSNAEVSDDY